MKFLAYDLNLLGPHESFPLANPEMWLSPGNDRMRRPGQYRGQPKLEHMAAWLMDNCANKFKMNIEDLDYRVHM